MCGIYREITVPRPSYNTAAVYNHAQPGSACALTFVDHVGRHGVQLVTLQWAEIRERTEKWWDHIWLAPTWWKEAHFPHSKPNEWGWSPPKVTFAYTDLERTPQWHGAAWNLLCVYMHNDWTEECTVCVSVCINIHTYIAHRWNNESCATRWEPCLWVACLPHVQLYTSFFLCLMVYLQPCVYL